MKKFVKWILRWYDNTSRVDFAGTMLGVVFDWRTSLVSLLGGAGTFFWAAIEGRSPLDMWLMTVIAAACCALVTLAVLAVTEKLRPR